MWNLFLINIEINEYLEFLSCKKSLLTGNDKRTRLMYEGIQVGNCTFLYCHDNYVWIHSTDHNLDSVV